MELRPVVLEFIVPDDAHLSEEALAALSHLRLERGDFISVSPGDSKPVEVARQYPANYGALLGALTIGAIRPADPAMHPSDVVSLLSRLIGANPPPPAAGRPRLRVEK